MSDNFNSAKGSDAPAISVRGLIKRYQKAKVNAVDGVSFDVSYGRSSDYWVPTALERQQQSGF